MNILPTDDQARLFLVQAARRYCDAVDRYNEIFQSFEAGRKDVDSLLALANLDFFAADRHLARTMDALLPELGGVRRSANRFTAVGLRYCGAIYIATEREANFIDDPDRPRREIIASVKEGMILDLDGPGEMF